MLEVNGITCYNFPDDFQDAESFVELVRQGDLVLGKVDNKVDFGVFISLDYSRPFHSISGLIPNRFLGEENLPYGSLLPFRVQQIDSSNPEKLKITLSPQDFEFRARTSPNRGQSSHRRRLSDIDIDKPIDNSDVEIPDGEKQITFVLPDPENPKTGKPAQRLRFCIKELCNQNPILEMVASSPENNNDDIDFVIAGAILDMSFQEGFEIPVFLRNLTFEANDSEHYRFGVRVIRQPGDALETELKIPADKTFLFCGMPMNNGRTFSIDQILMIAASEERLPYEVQIDIENVDAARRIQHPFIHDLLDRVVSVNRYTNQKLSLWNEYLDWSERVAKAQIKGCKYISRDLDLEDGSLDFWIVFENEGNFKKLSKILRRQEISIYSDNISSNRWKFVYNNDLDRGFARRKLVTESIGGLKGKPEGYSYDELPKNVNIKDKEMLLSTYSNPYFARCKFELQDYDLDDLANLRSQESFSAEDAEKFSGEILAKYPVEGFLALSAVGDLTLLRRLKSAIEQIKNGESFNPRIGEWLFDVKQARIPGNSDPINIESWLDPRVANNADQRNAIEKVLKADDLFLLQGPPGTGKTTVIAEIIYQCVRKGQRVLLASQSNDAVDNALERLISTPEIRAIRLAAKKKFHRNVDLDDETSLDKLSEDTALKFYYRSLSKKLSTEAIDRWTNNENGQKDCQKDLNDLSLMSENLERTNARIKEKNDLLKSLDDNRNQNLESIGQAVDQNEKNQLARVQYRNYCDFLENLETDFSLSEELVTEAAGIAISLNDRNFSLIRSVNGGLSNYQKNEIIRNFILNVASLKKLSQDIKRGDTLQATQGDLEKERLLRERDSLQTKMDSATSDKEYDDLEAQIKSINKEIRKLSQSSSSFACALDSTQKRFLSESFQEKLNNNRKEFLDQLDIKLNSCESVLKQITEQVSNYIDGLLDVDVTPLKKSLIVIQNKIGDEKSRLNKLNESKHNVEEKIAELCRKYEVNGDFTTNSAKELINSKLRALISEGDSFGSLKEDFGNLLCSFKSKLEKHINDNRLMNNDNDNYRTTYINACNVVGISCTADPRTLSDRNLHDFDVVIIDEVSKATPPELLLPLMRARKVVLVGDHRQLPPMFKTNERSYEELVDDIMESDDYTEEEKELLSKDNFDRFKSMVTASLFKEYFENAPEQIKASLTTQYRMHTDIMKVINRFYDGRLTCGIDVEKIEAVKAHNLTIPTLSGKPFITPTRHAVWIDSSFLPDGTPFYESHVGTSSSCNNFLEENLIVELLRKIDKGYDSAKLTQKVTVGVISFYQATVSSIRRKIKRLKFRNIQVSTNTVDRFQGQEKNIIIASLVRSKPADKSGLVHISKHVLAFERINVAFSRAQNLLVVVGSKNTFNGIDVDLPTMDNTGTRTFPVYKNIMNDLNQKACFFKSDCIVDKDVADAAVNENQRNMQQQKAFRDNHKERRFKR